MLFFKVNAEPGERCVPSILTLMGSKMYSFLRSIVAPRKPKELSFTETVASLAQHLDLKPIIIAEHYKFHNAKQGESESICKFIRLQILAKTCEFGVYREEAIHDRFLCGFRDCTSERKLLVELSLVLQSAVEKACLAELTEKESSVAHGDSVVKRVDRSTVP